MDILESNRGVDRAVTYVEGENSERRVPYGDVHTRALGILHHLQAMGAQRGDKMIIFLSNNEQFLDGFWAAVCGGIVPVPLAVGISDEHRHKLLRVARKLGKPLLVHRREESGAAAGPRRAGGRNRRCSRISSRAAFLVESITDISRPGKLYRPAPDDLAFIQFSSGSTSEPKGVMLTHGNLLANTRGATAAGKFTDQDLTLSWMPLTHDMGLIGFYLMQFANRIHIHLMPTELFVRRPLLWLQIAAKKRVTLTCSPNFGYRHFLKVLGDRRLEGVDLSCIRQIYNGAEPISVDLCNEFMNKLAYTGLKRQAMFPVYGLAEASLAVTFPELGADYRWMRVNRHKLGVGAQIEINPDRRARRAGADVRRPRGAEHGAAHRGRFARGTAGGRGGPYFDPRRQRDPRLLRRSGGHRARDRRGRLGRHGRSRFHARGLAVHRRPQQGNHLRQRPELLSLRFGEHRAARARDWISTSSWPRESPSPARRARSWWCSCSIAAAWRNFCPPRRRSAA